jgi:4a-hydroxytetrahydrobiopterin dehydratase
VPLTGERCVPCEGGTPPLSEAEARGLLAELGDGWQLANGGKALTRELKFKDFAQAMAFLNRLADVAEAEGHHPDFCLHGWNQVSLTLATHAIGGLSRNDFILAAKANQAAAAPA